MAGGGEEEEDDLGGGAGGSVVAGGVLVGGGSGFGGARRGLMGVGGASGVLGGKRSRRLDVAGRSGWSPCPMGYSGCRMYASGPRGAVAGGFLNARTPWGTTSTLRTATEAVGDAGSWFWFWGGSAFSGLQAFSRTFAGVELSSAAGRAG